MDDALRVRGVERVGDLDAELEQRRFGQRAGREPVL